MENWKLNQSKWQRLKDTVGLQKTKRIVESKSQVGKNEEFEKQDKNDLGTKAPNDNA